MTGAESLTAFIERHPRLFVLTGAGCSTDSGIPDYRDAEGEWKRKQPVQFLPFMTDPLTRQRYWARSLIGWRYFGRAKPNRAHEVLAELGRQGRIELLVTQNVDCLHQAAGSESVVDLHGRIDTVRCMSCEQRTSRDELQDRLLASNPSWTQLDAGIAPDGDADLEAYDFSSFIVPPCDFCGGLLKPDVVFFGESVPADRVARAVGGLQRADAMLVVGSSLMVYSGYRFAVFANDAGLPIAAVNLGRTRADSLLSLKLALPCAEVLAQIRPQAFSSSG